MDSVSDIESLTEIGAKLQCKFLAGQELTLLSVLYSLSYNSFFYC